MIGPAPVETPEERRKRKKREKDARYYQRHKDRLLEKNRQYYLENRPDILFQLKSYREENKERRVNQVREWRKNNREKYLKKNAEWRQQNPERARAICANRRARVRGAGGKHTAADIIHMMNAQKNMCAYCRVNISKLFEVDHIIPIARGGSNLASNLQLLCPDCNRRKSDKDPIDFMRERGCLL